jgi:tetratricopeptide (TPR) repeat protein
MTIGRGIAAGAVALAVLGSTAAQAQIAAFARNGDWEAFGGLDTDGKTAVCAMTQKTKDRYLGIKFYQGDKSFVMHLSSPHWHSEDKDHDVSFMIDGGDQWAFKKGGVPVTRFTDGGAGVEFEVAAEQLDLFVREFRAGKQMRFAFPTIDAAGWTVSLAGSSAISDAFDRCRHIQKTNDSVLGQPLQRCFKSEGRTPAQAIEGCTTVIAAGLWTGKDAAIPLQQRAAAFERNGDYEHVVADTSEILRLWPDAAGARAARGRAHFFQGDFSAAAADFSKSAELKDDSYTMIWRFLARRRVGPEGASELAAGTGKLTTKGWPYAIIDLYLERRSADEMQAAVTKPEEKCEAAFYLAEWHLLKANAAEAKPLLQTAADTCPDGFVERSGAQAELKRLGQ